MCYSTLQVGDVMFHLVIAKGKNCNVSKVIKSGSYEDLSSYTTKFNDSIGIRNKHKDIVFQFNALYNSGDIVIMDDSNNNTRVKVLYKSHVKIAKELIKSQNLMKYLVEHNILIVSTYDYKAIMYYKPSDYKKHMKDFLTRNGFYNTIRIIIKGYEMYQTKHKDLPSIYVMQKELDNENGKKTINISSNTVNNLNSNIKNIDYYETIMSSVSNGGMEEIFNTHSLDELASNLYKDDFKKLVKSGYDS